MPTIPFLTLSILLGTTSYVTKKNRLIVQAVKNDEQIKTAEPIEEKVEQYLQVDPIEVEIGYGLISLVDEKGGNLFQKISSTRKLIALEYGVLIPPVRVRDNLQLPPNEYIIKIKGNVLSHYDIYPDRFLAMNSGMSEDSLTGIETTDPAFGMQSYWIVKEERESGNDRIYSCRLYLCFINAFAGSTKKEF